MSHQVFTYQCQVKDVPSQPVMSTRLRTPLRCLPERLSEAFGAVYAYVSEKGGQPAGPPFVAYYNDDMQDLDIEVGFPVTNRLEGRDNVQPGEIPGGQAAACLHIGPYNCIQEAYAALNGWMHQQGLEGTRICYEFYLNDPATSAPEMLETEVVMPLKTT